ncbi:hypothetical protein DITRI_Ditri07aG0044200 [Diplodiscus trichospermus]
MEKLSLVLPETPSYVPRQFGRCAVIGNSRGLLKTRGSAKALDKVLELDETRQEVLIIKTTIHDIMSQMIRPLKGLSLRLLNLLSLYVIQCPSIEKSISFDEVVYGLVKLIKIHSPMQADPNRVVKWVPGHSAIIAARIASEKLLRRVGAGSKDLLGSCSIIKKQVKRKHMSVSRLRKATIDHKKFVKGTTMYPLEHSSGHGQLCTVPVD